MENNVMIFDDSDYSFTSISDFKWCMECGGEVQFEWKGKEFCAFGRTRKSEDSPDQLYVGPNCVTEEEYPGVYEDLWCDTSDEALEYVINGDRLRDIITKVGIIERTI